MNWRTSDNSKLFACQPVLHEQVSLHLVESILQPKSGGKLSYHIALLMSLHEKFHQPLFHGPLRIKN